MNLKIDQMKMIFQGRAICNSGNPVRDKVPSGKDTERLVSMGNSGIFYGLIIGFFLLIAFTSRPSFGQRFYFKAAIGGGIGVNGSDFITSSYSLTDSSVYINSSSVKYASLGNGISPWIAAGCNVGRNVSFELAIGYNKRFPVKFNSVDHYRMSGLVFDSDWEYKYTGHSFCLVPAIILSPDYKKFNPYCKVGFILSKGKIKETDSTCAFGRGYTFRYEHCTDYFFGVKTALGFDIPLAKRVKLFVEAAYDNIDFMPEKTTLVEYTTGGTSLMGGMNVSEREIIYVDDVCLQGPQDITEPTAVLKQKMSLNTVTLTIGIKI